MLPLWIGGNPQQYVICCFTYRSEHGLPSLQNDPSQCKVLKTNFSPQHQSVLCSYHPKLQKATNDQLNSCSSALISKLYTKTAGPLVLGDLHGFVLGNADALLGDNIGSLDLERLPHSLKAKPKCLPNEMTAFHLWYGLGKDVLASDFLISAGTGVPQALELHWRFHCHIKPISACFNNLLLPGNVQEAQGVAGNALFSFSSH